MRYFKKDSEVFGIEKGQEYIIKNDWIEITKDEALKIFNPPPTAEDIKREFIDKVQNIIDDTAKARGYDDMNSVAKYLRPSSPFYSEAVALLDWTDSAWVKLYEIQANIGTTIPTIDEIIAQLPKFSEV